MLINLVVNTHLGMEWEMSSLAIALVGLLGVILGLGAAAFWQWMDRKEKYQLITFDKRLAAHQDAFSLCYKLSIALENNNLNDIGSVATEMRNWWSSHCLFLGRPSRALFFSLAQTAYSMAEEHDMSVEGKCWELFGRATKAIWEEIGEKHLPELVRAHKHKNEKGKST